MRLSKYTDGMVSRILSAKLSLRIQFLLYLASFSILVLWMSGSLADTSYYYQSGQKVFQGQNPYSGDLPFFSGPTGGWFLYVIGKVFFIESFPLVWQIVNLLGVSIFFHTILTKLRVHSNLGLLIAIMLLSSPIREMVVNNQVTGFVLGIAAFTISTRLHTVHNIVIILNSMLLYLMFELKPNLVLGFVVYFIVTNKKKLHLIILSVTSIFVLANLLLMDGIYLKWFNAIQSQGVANLTGYESLGLSTFIYESDMLSKENARILGLSLFLFCLVLVLITALFKGVRIILLAIPLLAIFFPYVHYLDFAITVPFIIHFVLYRTNLRYIAPIAIVILYLPGPTGGLLKNLLVFLILAAVITYDFYRYKLRCNVAVGVLFGAALLLSNFLFDSHARNDHQLQSFTVVRAWLIISSILLWELTSNRQSKSSSFVKVLEFNLKRFWK
jgi:hypothetical protein